MDYIYFRWWVNWRRLRACLLLSLTLVGQSAHAGVSASRPCFLAPQSTSLSDTTSHLTDSAQLATITADTGALASGNRDFSRYDAPGLCRAAALWERTVARRTLEAQASRLASLRHTPAGQYDTVGTSAAAAVARACGAHFTVTSTTARDLHDLFELALLAENDTLAQTVLAKLVAQAPNASDRSEIRLQALQEYLQAQPTRMAAANALVAQVDAQSPSNYDERLQVHAQFLNYFGERNVIFTGADTVRLRQEAEQILIIGRAHKELSKTQMSFMVAAYQTLMELAVFEHPDSVVAVAQRAKQDLSSFKVATSSIVNNQMQNKQWKRMPFTEVMNRLAPAWYYDMQRYYVDKPAPPLMADAWFPASGASSRDTPRPVQDKVNLICTGGIPMNYTYGGSKIWEGSGAEVTRLLTSWLQEYGADGLVVTVVAAADSYIAYGMGDGEVIEKLWRTSADEAIAWRWYYQTYERLPILVAVQRRRTTEWLPAPDSRRMTTTDIQLNRYDVAGGRDIEPPGSCAIIGRDGHIVYFDENGYKGHEYIQDVLRWLFTGPGAHASSSIIPADARPPASPSPRSSRGTSQ